MLSFAAGPERFAELVEVEGVFPAPYFARAYWVAVERWNTLPASELKEFIARGAGDRLREVAEEDEGGAGREREEKARGQEEAGLSVGSVAGAR